MQRMKIQTSTTYTALAFGNAKGLLESAYEECLYYECAVELDNEVEAINWRNIKLTQKIFQLRRRFAKFSQLLMQVSVYSHSTDKND